MAGARARFLVAAALLAGSTAAQLLAWTTEPYYFADASLPSPGSDSCCGSQLVGDPSIGDTGNDCLCDLTVGECDVGCCCDTSCSNDELKLNGVFGCTSNGTATRRLGYTLCSDQLVDENIPQSLKDQGLVTALGGADGPLCIVTDNSASRGAFFLDPAQSGAAFTPEKVSQEITRFAPYGYDSWLETVESPFSVTTYQLGASLMRAVAGSTTSLTPNLMPAASSVGGCDGKQQIPFLQGVAPFTCALTPPGTVADASHLASLCGTTLDGSFLTTETFKAAPTSVAADVPKNIFWRVDDGPFTSGVSTPTAPYHSATGTCPYALISYQMRMVAAHDGTLSSVSIYATVTNLTLPALPTATASYAAVFEYASESGARSSSGRPGYQRGRPLLVADGESDLQLRTTGMKMLPHTAIGRCATGSGDSTAQVLFGEDMVTSCTITYQTAANLKTACGGDSGIPPASLPASLIDALNISATKIGAYGDSHPGMSADWVTLNTLKDGVQWTWDPTALLPTWSNEKQECSNFVSGMHLRVLTAEVGSVSNPITRVVGAELEVNVRKLRAAQCALGASCPTTVSVSASASFASVDGESFDFTPESPSIIGPLPYDFFYPFRMDRS